MPRVTHDFLVRYAIAICSRHESGAQSVGAHRFRQRALQPCFGSTFEKNLPYRIGHQPARTNNSAAAHLPEHWAGQRFPLRSATAAER